jgi:hypothetical protein
LHAREANEQDQPYETQEQVGDEPASRISSLDERHRPGKKSAEEIDGEQEEENEIEHRTPQRRATVYLTL